MTNRALLCIPVLRTFTFCSCRCLFVKFRWNLVEFRQNAQPSARYVATFSHPATHQQSKPLENSSVIPNNLKTDYCPSTSPSCAVPHHFCKFLLLLLLLLLLLMGSSNKHMVPAMVVPPGFQEPIIPFLSDCGLSIVAEFLQ
jgi:hypothetical protein